MRWPVVAGAMIAAVCLAVAPARTASGGRSWYAAPNGSPGNDGSFARPLDLATAISSSGPALPGDTIWLRGGVYKGAFTSTLTGTSASPITVRQYPGERATIDGSPSPALSTFVVLGAWTVYWGFEITNSDPNRIVDISGRGTGLDIYAPNTKFINMIVHDAQTGIGFWTPAVSSELYGNLVYNNGIDWSDRGHGHSIYAQNQTGIKRIVDNVLFNSFSFGIHAYTQGGSVDNFLMDGNVSFNHGVLSAVSGAKSNLLLGGGQVAHNATITNNIFYSTTGNGGRGADIGYGVACADSLVQGNAFVADTAVALNCSNTPFTGNWLFGWLASGFSASYPGNTFYSARPTTPSVTVRPNQYEAGRANITIFNWSRQAQVAVDLAAAKLNVGDAFEIRDAENYFGQPIVSGTYTGAPVSISMIGLTVAPPIGNAPIVPAHTAPDFGVFIVARPFSAGSSATASLVASPTTVTAGQSATLTWSTTNASSVSISPAPGTVNASGSATVTPGSTTTYTLTATSQSGTPATSSVTINVTNPPPPTGAASSATFLRSDATTQGNWKGVYGASGYAFPYAGTSMPAGAALGLSGQAAWLWTGSATDIRALVNPANTVRTAATWYSAGSFSMDVNLTDGAAHQLALYSLDWDGLGRAQTVDLVDAGSGALLDRQSVTGFTKGQYLVWQVTGHFVVRVTRTAGANAVVSGLFLDPAGATVTPPPTPPPSAGGNAASFVGANTTVQGNWKGAFGGDGYAVSSGATSVPTYAKLTFGGQSSWVWAGGTSDVRALLNAAGTGRTASTWYSGSAFTIDVAITDGASHQVSVYGLDWDSLGRAQTIEVLDAATGAVLDRQNASAFVPGVYWTWRVSGHVIFRFTRTAGANAVVAGVFFDR